MERGQWFTWLLTRHLRRGPIFVALILSKERGGQTKRVTVSVVEAPRRVFESAKPPPAHPAIVFLGPSSQLLFWIHLLSRRTGMRDGSWSITRRIF